MTLEEALVKIGELETAQEPLAAERDRLKTHNERLLKSVAKANERAETAENERDDVRGKLPAEGTVTLPKADAELLDNYRALGKLDELSGRLEKGENALIIAHAATMRENLRQLGYEPTERLLKDFADVTLSVKDSEDKKSKVGTVTADGKDVAFGDWLKTSGLEGDMARYRSDTRSPGVQVLPQYSGQGSSGVSGTAQIVNDLNTARSERHNPLLKGENNGTTNQKLS